MFVKGFVLSVTEITNAVNALLPVTGTVSINTSSGAGCGSLAGCFLSVGVYLERFNHCAVLCGRVSEFYGFCG